MVYNEPPTQLKEKQMFLIDRYRTHRVRVEFNRAVKLHNEYEAAKARHAQVRNQIAMARARNPEQFELIDACLSNLSK